jgi:hypothetical protein
MKNKLLMFAMFAALLLTFFISSALAEVDLEVVWQNNLSFVQTKYPMFSPDDKFIYIASMSKLYKVSSINGDSLSIFDNAGLVADIYSPEISKSGSYIVNDCGNGAVSIWDVIKEKAIKTLNYAGNVDLNGNGTKCISISPDDRYLIIGLLKPEGNNLIIYDFQADKELMRLPCPGNVEIVKYSHNGRYFITGSTKYDADYKKYYTKLLLWDAITYQQISAIEDYVGNSDYRYIKFSANDAYVGYRNGTYVNIYDINSKQTIKNTENNPIYNNFVFLVDNQHYLLFGGKSSDNYDLELFNINGDKVNNYKINGSFMESGNTNIPNYIFCSSGSTNTLLKITSTDVKNIDNSKIPINIQSLNGKLIFELNDIIFPKLTVILSDLRGKKHYQNSFDIQTGQTKIELDTKLSNGIYLCKIIVGNKEYTQKIEIVR